MSVYIVKKSEDAIKKIIPIIIFQKINNETIVVIGFKQLLFSLAILKNHITYRYKILSCISGVDLLSKSYRFCVSYDFLSLTFNSRIRVKVFLDEICFIPSIVYIFSCANWWEREVWDMYGLYFDKHPDLRRILTDYGFEGYPMKKDFPLSGFTELKYDESKKRIVSDFIELSQDLRFFNFETPW